MRLLGGFIALVLVIAAIGTVYGWVATDDTERIENQNRAADDDSGAGSPSSYGAATVFDLRAGDCFREPGSGEPGEYYEISIVSCSEGEGDYKVTDLMLVPDSDSFPGVAAMDGHALECGVLATTYYGPTEESWEAGDRTIICLQEL
jgi:hypothetical protein